VDVAKKPKETTLLCGRYRASKLVVIKQDNAISVPKISGFIQAHNINIV